VNDGNGGLVDQPMGEPSLLLRNAVPPVRPPMHGNHDDIVRPSDLNHLIRDRGAGCLRQVAQQVHSGRVLRCGPGATSGGGKRKYEDARRVCDFQNCRCHRLSGIKACPCRLDLKTLKGRERVEQSRAPPIQHVVVAEHTAVHSACGQTAGILRAHSVVDSLGDMGVATRDAGFEVDDACIRPRAGEFVQSRTPDVGEVDRRRNWSVRLLRQPDIARRRRRVPLVEAGGAWIGKHLVKAPPRHHVPAQKDLHGLDQPAPLSVIHAGQGRLGKQMLAGLALDVAA
jgi:hypothetical protein